MSVQIYTSTENLPVNQELQKIHAAAKEQIIEYVEELKKYGYEIIEFPEIEYHFKMYFVNVIVEYPRNTE